MRFARQRVATRDGVEYRLIASADGGTSWWDVRRGLVENQIGRGSTPAAAVRIASALVPGSLSAALAGGDQFLDVVAEVLETAPGAAAVVAAENLTNAIDPASYRDFMVFEDHFSFGYRWQGRPVPDVMYEFPVSYAGDPNSFLGPGDEIPWPAFSERLDYELELGIVIGRSAANLTPDTALDHVLGLTILNDVSARDIQAREMTGGLGPSKGKHFACITGPVVVTLDEIPSVLGMRASVNGELLCDARSDEMVWSVAEVVAWASQGERLAPGALLGSGTCNGGSTIELGRTLEPGDELVLEIDELGSLSNRLGLRADAGWMPRERDRRVDGTSSELHFLD